MQDWKEKFKGEKWRKNFQREQEIKLPEEKETIRIGSKLLKISQEKVLENIENLAWNSCLEEVRRLNNIK